VRAGMTRHAPSSKPAPSGRATARSPGTATYSAAVPKGLPLYAHFASKEDLVATAVADQLREQRASVSAQTPDRAGLEQYVRGYLSVQHRDCPDDGCPSAALLDEIGRCTDAVKRAYTDGVLVVIDDIAARLAPDDPQSARVKTLSVFAMMVGTLQLSRALADRQLADEVLEQGIQNALALLGAEHQS
jgi:TetR/AcrR family transcriptional regulator, transcriptional repressor for nem operon